MATQQPNITVSKKWWLTARDFGQAFIMAGLGAVGGQLYAIGAKWVTSDTFTGIDKQSLILALKGFLFAGALDLARRFIKGRQILITNPSKEIAEAVKAGEPVKIADEVIVKK